MYKGVEEIYTTPTRAVTMTAEHFYGEKSDGSALYWHHHQMSATEVSPGASGATFVPPGANTIGGYELDVNDEFLYMSAHIGSDWVGEDDIQVRVNFECNVNNTGGADTDTVDLKLVLYYKGHDETANKTQTLEEHVVVGKSAQYKRHVVVFTVDWDASGNICEKGDKFGLILNLETDTSEVDNVIINTINWRYKTKLPAVEVQ